MKDTSFCSAVVVSITPDKTGLRVTKTKAREAIKQCLKIFESGIVQQKGDSLYMQYSSTTSSEGYTTACDFSDDAIKTRLSLLGKNSVVGVMNSCGVVMSTNNLIDLMELLNLRSMPLMSYEDMIDERYSLKSLCSMTRRCPSIYSGPDSCICIPPISEGQHYLLPNSSRIVDVRDFAGNSYLIYSEESLSLPHIPESGLKMNIFGLLIFFATIMLGFCVFLNFSKQGASLRQFIARLLSKKDDSSRNC